jgi:hypothetical protein
MSQEVYIFINNKISEVFLNLKSFKKMHMDKKTMHIPKISQVCLKEAVQI